MKRRLLNILVLGITSYLLSASGLFDAQLTWAQGGVTGPCATSLGCGGGSGGGGITIGTTVVTGGADTQVLFNDAATVGGDAGLTYNKTTDTLTVSGAIKAPDGTTAAPGIQHTSGTGGIWFSSATSGPQFNYTTNGFACGVNNGVITGAFICRGSGAIGFGNADTSGATADTFLARSAAGVMRMGSTASNIRYIMGGGTAVASASALPLPTGSVFHVTGTTNVTSITSTNFAAGAQITIIFDGVLTFTDGSNLVLAGNFVTTADDTITLVYDGTNWYEMARAVN